MIRINLLIQDLLLYTQESGLEIIDWPHKFKETGNLNANFTYKCLKCGHVFKKGGHYIKPHC